MITQVLAIILLSTAATFRALRSFYSTIRLFALGIQCKANGTEMVIIPVLDCPDLAIQAAIHFHQITEVVFVGSHRDEKGTVSALQRVGARVLVAPKSCIGKASQIQWALSILPETHWVTIYDVDSRPSSHSLTYFSRGVTDGDPDVISRLSMYQSGTAKGFFEGLALRQSWWSIMFEAQMWTGRRIWYLVGHGLSVRWSLLRSYLSEDAVSEDLSLGYELSILKASVCIGTDVDVALAVDSVSAAVLQTGKWFAGEWDGTRRLPMRHRLQRRIEVLFSWSATWLLLTIYTFANHRISIGASLFYVIYTSVAYLVSSRLSLSNRLDMGQIMGFFMRDVIFGLGLLVGGISILRRCCVYDRATNYRNSSSWTPRSIELREYSRR